MRLPYQEPRIGNRRWIAWKLVQLAAKIYDAERYERIYITNPDGLLIWEAEIVGDLYGNGVSSVLGRDSDPLPAGSIVRWDEIYDLWGDDE